MRRLLLALWSTSALSRRSSRIVRRRRRTASAIARGACRRESADAPQSTATTAGSTGDNAIVVTGMRRALQSARNIKRNSTRSSMRSSLRILASCPTLRCPIPPREFPASRSSANGGEASRVLLRGLDRTYYTTTYNGREIFTAETRSVALQDFPAGAIAAVEAFKTSTANLVEPGLAGSDQRAFAAAVRLQGFRDRRLRLGRLGKPGCATSSRKGQILVTDRWRAGDGEFGALINFSYTQLHYQDSIRRHGFFIADLAGYPFARFPEIRYFEGDRWRPSINGALQ